MAPEQGENGSADKGKGKAADQSLPSEKPVPNGTSDEKDLPLVNGKKKDEPKEDELSEEDKQLQEELVMLVERLQESDTSLYKPALQALKDSIKNATSSMTAVPKPLKFLRPHYKTLEEIYAKWPDSEDKKGLADVLSVVSMVSGEEKELKTLNYRLQAPTEDIASWGHEYVRHLALEVGRDYLKRLETSSSMDDLMTLSDTIVPYFMTHNAEADAVDLLMELERVQHIKKFIDKNNLERVCLYMSSMVNLLAYPDDKTMLRTLVEIYKEHGKDPQAIVASIRLGDRDVTRQHVDSLTAPEQKPLRHQLAFMLARQGFWEEPIDEEDEIYKECLGNGKFPEYFKTFAKELNILDPKKPEDIYKSHLESSRTGGLTNVETSAKHNLSSAIVNGFVNAGFGSDELIMTKDPSSNWVWKTKDDGKMTTVASLGMLLRWDWEEIISQTDKYMYEQDVNIKSGALLALGIATAGLRIDADPALGLLGDADALNKDKPELSQMACIMGLGLAYAGTNDERLLSTMLTYIEEGQHTIQLAAMAALSLGMIYVGEANDAVTSAILTLLLDETRQEQLGGKWTPLLALGLALLFYGRQEESDVIIETIKAVEHPSAKGMAVLAEVCAWAGSGAVLKIQELLHICNETVESGDNSSFDEIRQSYAVLGIALIAMGEDIGQDMVLRQFGHLMHYGEPWIRKVVPLAMGLISPSNPQMKIYDTLSRYSHDTDPDVAANAIFAMGLVGAGTNNARIAQLLRSLASYYHRDANALFMVRIAQALLHAGKGTMTFNPFHGDRQMQCYVASAGILTTLVALIDPPAFILGNEHWLIYYLCTAMYPRFLMTLDEDLKPLSVNVRVGQAVDVVGQAGRPKTITGWQTQSTPVLLSYGDRAELEDDKYISLAAHMEGLIILKKNPDYEEP